MALETLKDLKEVNGFKIIKIDELKKLHPEKFSASGAILSEFFESEIRPNYFIFVRDDKNSISFNIQNGPIKEFGVNGVQVNEMISIAKIMIEGLNKKFPCRENSMAIEKLEESLMWLERRKKNREARGVEGKSLK